MTKELLKYEIISLIKDKKFNSKEELIEFLKQVNSDIMENDLNEIKTDILNEFDKHNETNKNYNIEEVEIFNKRYIQYVDDGNVTLLENEVDQQHTLDEQIKHKENEMTDLDQNTEVAEKDMMRLFDKEKIDADEGLVQMAENSLENEDPRIIRKEKDNMNQNENNERDIYQDFTNNDLNDLLNYGTNTLSDAQKADIQSELQNRMTQDNTVKPLEKERVKVFKKEFNGFSSMVALSVITGVGGLSIFMYILLMIGG